MARLIFSERPELEGQLHVAYCPERVLPGNVLHELVHNDRVIGGIDEASTQRAIAFTPVSWRARCIRPMPGRPRCVS